MKKYLLMLSAFSFMSLAGQAQNDTILYENFDVDPTASYATFNSGNDTVWVNFDADGLPDFNARPQEWFWSEGGVADVDSIDAMLFSSSWLTSVTPPNRNWLMTPPLDLTNIAGATLSWAAAPRQTPLFVDGYTVMVSTTDNIESSFTDTLFQAAQYISGSGFDFSAYVFSPGFVHGEDGTYIQFDPASDSSRFIGELRPFSVSLAQYAGQSIYITFLHDSDDDNLIFLDDILVTGTLVGLNESADDIALSISPNPATEKVYASFMLSKSSIIDASLYDVKGNKIIEVSSKMQSPGLQKIEFNVNSLAAGLYNIMINVNGNSVSKRFVKQ